MKWLNFHLYREEKIISARLVSKRGCTNIEAVRVPGRHWSYLSDFFTTLVDIEWRWNIIIFLSGFIATWALFAAYYWLVCQRHGDFMDVPKGWIPCVVNITSFVSAFLFSVETQSTIGYGFRYVTDECPMAYIGVLIQSIISAGLQVALAGLVVAKVRRSKKRSETIVFSRIACIMEEDLCLRLIFRVADIRKSHIIGAHARGYLIRKSPFITGKTIPIEYFQVDFKSEDGSNSLFLAWPTSVVHVIDENSPFWKLSRDNLRRENFELLILLEGIVQSTSKTFLAKTSYLSWDIIWGHRFETLGRKIDKCGFHIVDYANFNQTHPVPTPICSACDIKHLRETGKLFQEIQKQKLQMNSSKRNCMSDTFLSH